MGNLDLSNQPVWLAALIVFCTGVVVPIALAWIGKLRAVPDEPAPIVPPIPIEVETPWMVQNLLEIKINTERAVRSIDALTKAIADLAIQVNTTAALLKRHK